MVDGFYSTNLYAIMKYLIALILVFSAPVSAQTCLNCGVPLTIDAQQGGIEYTSEGIPQVEAVTKALNIRAGYSMVKVSHPPKYVCSEYAVADTFELRPTSVRRARVTTDRVTTIREALK